MAPKGRTRPSAQVQAFRELAAKISGPEAEARFEDALGTILRSKNGSKQRSKARDTMRGDGPSVMPGLVGKAGD